MCLSFSQDTVIVSCTFVYDSPGRPVCWPNQSAEQNKKTLGCCMNAIYVRYVWGCKWGRVDICDDGGEVSDVPFALLFKEMSLWDSVPSLPVFCWTLKNSDGEAFHCAAVFRWVRVNVYLYCCIFENRILIGRYSSKGVHYSLKKRDTSAF